MFGIPLLLGPQLPTDPGPAARTPPELQSLPFPSTAPIPPKPTALFFPGSSPASVAPPSWRRPCSSSAHSSSSRLSPHNPHSSLASSPLLPPLAPPMHWPQVSPALTSQPLAMAKPPPRRRMIFQGTVSWAFFQLSRGSVSELGARWRKGPSPAQSCLIVGRDGQPWSLCGDFRGPQEVKPASNISLGL